MWRILRSASSRRSLWVQREGSSLYHQGASQSVQRDARVVELRSDVFTKPTPEMRKIMADAEVGDDVFGECSVTNALQERVAKLFGKEDALFVTSGTMGNEMSVFAHCPERGREVILGDKCHLFLWEQGGISQIGGLHANTIPNLSDGTYPVEEIVSRIRPTNDVHYPLTGLICVENTHNYCSGSIVPTNWLKQVKEIATEHKLPVHMDGARVMNAIVAMKVKPTDILQHVDSVNMCFSKGLGAPVGSIIAGTHEFIERARRLRKVMGGGWRQPGQLAAAANYTLDLAEETMTKDHKHAQMLLKALLEHGKGVISIKPENVHTNILMLSVTKPGLTSEQFCQRLAQVTEAEVADLKEAISVKSLPFGPILARLVLHWNVTTEDTEAAIRKLLYVLNELK